MLAGGDGEFIVLQSAEVHDDALAGGGDAASGAVQRGADDAGADHAAGGGVIFEELVVVAEAVYQGDKHGVGSDAGLGADNGVLKLIGLGHENDYVHYTDVVGAVCGLEAGEDGGLVRIDGELHAVLRDLVHVGLVRVDEGHVCPARAEIAGEHAACSAGTYHCDFHCFSSSYAY